MNYLTQLAREYDFIFKRDIANNEFAVMCLADKPLPAEVKHDIEEIVAYNYPGIPVRYIEAKGE